MESCIEKFRWFVCPPPFALLPRSFFSQAPRPDCTYRAPPPSAREPSPLAEEAEEELVFELSEEFKLFLAQSEAHRRERACTLLRCS